MRAVTGGRSRAGEYGFGGRVLADRFTTMRHALVLFLTLVTLGGLAHAEVYPSKAGKAAITIPAKWTVTASDELVRAVSPDGHVALVFWVVDSADAKDGIKKLEGELYSSVQSLRWVDKVKKVKINKLPATWIEGAGVNAAGNQLDVLVVVAGPTAAKKGVILFAAVEHEQLAANLQAIRSIFQTLRPTK